VIVFAWYHWKHRVQSSCLLFDYKMRFVSQSNILAGRQDSDVDDDDTKLLREQSCSGMMEWVGPKITFGYTTSHSLQLAS